MIFQFPDSMQKRQRWQIYQVSEQHMPERYRTLNSLHRSHAQVEGTASPKNLRNVSATEAIALIALRT